MAEEDYNYLPMFVHYKEGPITRARAKRARQNMLKHLEDGVPKKRSRTGKIVATSIHTRIANQLQQWVAKTLFSMANRIYRNNKTRACFQYDFKDVDDMQDHLDHPEKWIDMKSEYQPIDVLSGQRKLIVQAYKPDEEAVIILKIPGGFDQYGEDCDTFIVVVHDMPPA